MNYSRNFNGWIGEIALEVTYEKVANIAQTFSNYFKEHSTSGQKCIVAYDSRNFAKRFAEFFSMILAENGIKVFFANKTTPSSVAVISSLDKKSMGTVVLTGDSFKSHFLGIKVYNEHGFLMTPEDVETYQEDYSKEITRFDVNKWVKSGYIERFEPSINYKNYIEKKIDFSIVTSSHRILFNPLHGSGIHYFDLFLNEKNIHGYSINREGLSNFDGLEPSPSLHTTKLYDEMLFQGTEIGFMVSPDCSTFEFYFGPHRLTSTQILFLIAENMTNKGESGKILISEAFELNPSIFDRLPVSLEFVPEKEFQSHLRENKHLLALDRFNRFYFKGNGVADALLCGFYLVEIFNHEKAVPKLLQSKINEIKECL